MLTMSQEQFWSSLEGPVFMAYAASERLSCRRDRAPCRCERKQKTAKILSQLALITKYPV